MAVTNLIQVFEHSILHIGGKFEQRHFVALSKLNALHNDKYFDLRYNGIKFKQYVGVIQVEGLTIEILPKIDNDGRDESVWQKALIEMLRVTRKLKVQQVGQANVKKQQIHLLDIYFEWFLNEVLSLMHHGLIKKYYKETKNVKALKGKFEFAGHIAKNLVHKEQFYTTHQVYDKDHLLHQIIGQALEIVAIMSKGNYLYSRCKKTQLDFPEVKSIQATEATFSKIVKNRKTVRYDNAIAIARLIILNYAPNVSSGSEKMLALLFDMNSLWEQYILERLRNNDNNIVVNGQQSKDFWNKITIRPDIVLSKEAKTFIIDTKWKTIGNGKPSTDDLRQMYVYNDYWNADKAMLLYPFTSTIKSNFIPFENNDLNQCSLGRISIFRNEENILNEGIGDEIIKWFLEDNVRKEI